MPVKIVPIGEGEDYGPVVICDACGQRIEREDDGLYVWAYRRGESVHNRFYHHNNKQTNPECQEIYSRWDKSMREIGCTVQWGTLHEFASQLAHNVGVKPKEKEGGEEKVEEMPPRIALSAHTLLTILRGFLYMDGDTIKCEPLVVEIHEVQLWLEKRKAERQKRR